MGCGDDGAAPAKGAGGASGSAGAASGGTISGGTGGVAAAGSSAGGSAGSTALGSGSCLGQFGVAAPVVNEPMPVRINGVTVTADELEMYYARHEAVDTVLPTIVRRTRASRSEAFGAVEVVAGLEGVCAEGMPRVNPDISEDGLTLYVTCTVDVPSGQDEGRSLLRVARRPDRASAFALEAAEIGQVYAAAGISADELTAYTDGPAFDTEPVSFKRTAKTGDFSQSVVDLGITTSFRSPDISADDLSLFGAANTGVESTIGIYRATRASKDMLFGAPQLLELGVPHPGIGAPNITPSCNLYFVVIVPAQGQAVYLAAPQ